MIFKYIDFFLFKNLLIWVQFLIYTHWKIIQMYFLIFLLALSYFNSFFFFLLLLFLIFITWKNIHRKYICILQTNRFRITDGFEAAIFIIILQTSYFCIIVNFCFADLTVLLFFFDRIFNLNIFFTGKQFGKH